MNLKEKYLFLFYRAIGKPSDYVSRDDQVDNAYWLISITQFLNLSGLLFIYLSIFHVKLNSKILFFILMAMPLTWNYFIFKRKGNAKIILTVDYLLMSGKIKNKKFVLTYVIGSAVICLFCGALLNPHFRRWIRVTFYYLL